MQSGSTNLIFSCHAVSNGGTFTLGQDLWLYYFSYDTLHDGVAKKALDTLRQMGGNTQEAQKYWDTMRTSGKVKADAVYYKAGKNIEDYNIWKLDAKWKGDIGIFNFDDGSLLDDLSSTSKSSPMKLSAVLSQVTGSDISLFWLACNA